MDVEEGYLSVMADDGSTRDDLKLPEGDLGKEIMTKHENEEQFMVSITMIV